MSTPAVGDDVHADFRRAIVATYPALARARFSIAGRGWHSLAIDADDRLIFKFPEGEEAIVALRREASLLSAARPLLTTPVPDMDMHDGPPPFSVHHKLHGDTLPAERYATLDEASRARLGDDLGRFFAELHAIDRETMRAAGALPVEIWLTDDATIDLARSILPEELKPQALAALRDYRALPADPLGEVYGFFDAHGWNMAFDGQSSRLAGIFDFADSGFGSPHREFVQPSLISADLTLRAMAAYESLTGRGLDRRRVFLLTATQRLSELAGMIETDGDADAWRGAVAAWFAEAERFGWTA